MLIGLIFFLISTIFILILYLRKCSQYKLRNLDFFKTRKDAIHEVVVTLNHYINNPLSCVLADIQFALMKIKKNASNFEDKVLEKSLICLTSAEREALKIKEIMENIRSLEDMETEEYVSGITMLKFKINEKKPQ